MTDDPVHKDHHQPRDHEHGDKAGWWGRVRHAVRPHSHDAADSVDAALESSALGIHAVKVSLVVLGVTAVAQAAVAAVTGSVALLADTIHNLSDAMTAIPLWVAFVLGRRPATRRYTYGYGRAEDLAGIFIVLMIAASAVVAGYESIHRLLDPQPVEHVWWVVLAGMIGFAGNEAVAVYRIRIGRRIGSAALVADGLHARTDGFTSLAVVVGALGVLAGFPLADPIIGLVITLAILVVLKGAAGDIYRRLMDAVDPGLYDAAEVALLAVPGVDGVEQLRLRWVGHRILVEAGVEAAAGLSLVHAHAIATEAHHQLLHDVPRVVGATIHVSPGGEAGRAQHALLAHHHAMPSPARAAGAEALRPVDPSARRGRGDDHTRPESSGRRRTALCHLDRLT